MANEDEKQTVERKRGEKLSLFSASEQVPKKGVFVDVNKRLPDDVADHEAIEKALTELAPEGMWAVAPDIVADIAIGEKGESYALLHGENKDNQPVVAIMDRDFGFRQLLPSQPETIPGTQCEVTWLLHNEQVVVRPSGLDSSIAVSAFLMQD